VKNTVGPLARSFALSVPHFHAPSAPRRVSRAPHTPLPPLSSMAALPVDDPLITRRLARADFDAGFLSLLAQLSTVGDVDRAAFEGVCVGGGRQERGGSDLR